MLPIHGIKSSWHCQASDRQLRYFLFLLRLHSSLPSHVRYHHGLNSKLPTALISSTLYDSSLNESHSLPRRHHYTFSSPSTRFYWRFVRFPASCISSLGPGYSHMLDGNLPYPIVLLHYQTSGTRQHPRSNPSELFFDLVVIQVSHQLSLTASRYIASSSLATCKHLKSDTYRPMASSASQVRA